MKAVKRVATKVVMWVEKRVVMMVVTMVALKAAWRVV